MFLRMPDTPRLDFVRRCRLGDASPARVCVDPARLRVIVASERAVHCYAYGRYADRLFTVRVATNDAIQSLATIPTPQGEDIAFGTRAGRVCVLNGEGFLVAERQVTPAGAPGRPHAIWHLSAGQAGGRVLLCACAREAGVYLLDAQARVQAILPAPASMLHADMREADGRPWLAAGDAGRREVYVWSLHDVLRGRDAAPYAVLRGGAAPAFATRIVELDRQALVAHGSWDGRAYVYALPRERTTQVVRPRAVLHAGNPLYALAAARVEERTFLFAGTERGQVFGWDLSDLRRAAPTFGAPSFGSAIKALQAMQVGPAREPVLLAGARDGQCQLLQPASRESARRAILRVEPGEGEIRGVAVYEAG